MHFHANGSLSRLRSLASGSRLVLSLFLATLITACANLGTDIAQEWPEELPPLSYFEEAYVAGIENHEHQTREEYLYWVRSFYEGTTLYPRGWNSTTSDLLAATPSGPASAKMEARLYELGREIAAEWSKSGRVNLVKNGHLAVWGIAAQRAVDEANVDETIAQIADDVSALLARELSPEAVTAARYHPQDPDDFFAI